MFFKIHKIFCENIDVRVQLTFPIVVFIFLDHSTLQSFDVSSCGIKSCGELENNTAMELHILFKSNTIKQLSVVSCFNNPGKRYWKITL